MSGITTAHDAAVKILIGDFSEILERLEKCQRDQQGIEREFNADMAKLGAYVKAIDASASKVEESARVSAAVGLRIEDAAKRIEAVTGKHWLMAATSARQNIKAPVKGAVLMIGFAVLFVLVLVWAGAATWQISANRDAVIAGRAALKAWPALDADARKTIKASAAP